MSGELNVQECRFWIRKRERAERDIVTRSWRDEVAEDVSDPACNTCAVCCSVPCRNCGTCEDCARGRREFAETIVKLEAQEQDHKELLQENERLKKEEARLKKEEARLKHKHGSSPRN